MRRTAGFWVVAVVAVGVFYWLGSPGEVAPGWPRASFKWPAYLLVFGLFWLVQRRASLGHRELVEGTSLLQQGAFTRALAAFDLAASKQPRAPAMHYHRGLALVSLWRLAEAEQAFGEAARCGGSTEASLRSLLPQQWALASAVLGRVADARERLALAEQAGTGSAPEATLARLVLAARAGDWAAAGALAQRFELTQLGGWYRGLADALAGWAAEQLHEAGPAPSPVALLGEAGLPEVRKAWPELADFLARSAVTSASLGA